MATVTFKSIDETNRKVTFDVDGESVTRNIPAQYVGTIDDYIKACAKGLSIEYAFCEDKECAGTECTAGDVLVA